MTDFYSDADLGDTNPGHYPASVTGYAAWLPWKDADGKKLPTAELYADVENPFSWSNPETLTDFDTANQWARMNPEYEGVIYIIQDESEDGNHADFSDPFILTDYDDARDPKTGEVSPYARAFMDRLGVTYTDVSWSGSGLHQIHRGSLPEGVTTITFEFPDGSGVEMYDGKRPCAFTGDHVAGTPKDARPINENAVALAAMFHEGVSGKTKPDGESWEPETSREELADIETVDNMDTVADAIEQVRPRDIRLRSKKTGERANGTIDFDPTWEHSESGTRLGWDPDIGWIYRKGSTGLDALQVVSLEEGIIHGVNDYPEGGDWFEAVEALRDRGAHIPELKRSNGGATKDHYPGKGEGHDWDPEWVASVPLSRRAHSIASGWDWAKTDEATITREDVHDRVEREIDQAFARGERVVLNATMSTGKTFSAFKVAAQRNDAVTYLTARRDLYDQGARYANENGQNCLTLPSVHADCPSFCGEHGEHIHETVTDLYRRGATPQQIHERLDLPCEEGDGCPYRLGHEFDPEDYDVLIGHYSHAYLPHVVAGRHVVIDEYPQDTFRESLLGDELERSINSFLSLHGEFPADDYTEMIERRDDAGFVDGALDWFDTFDWDPDENGVFADDDYYAMTPHYVYAIIAGHPAGEAGQGYPFEVAHIPNGDRHTGVFERSSETTSKAAHVQGPPREWHMARSIVCLDGTPCLPMWENETGLRLKTREVLSSVEERRSFNHETLDIEVHQMSENVKPYSSGNWVTVDKDRAITERVAEEVKDPVVVSTKEAVRQYEADGWDGSGGPAKELANFGSLRGSNRYADEEAAVIHGSAHYGHRWVKREAAFQDEAVAAEGFGNEQDYGAGNEIARQMQEAVILQTILRFGRSEDTGAVVFLNTSVTPEDIDIAGTGAAARAHTKHQKTIFEVCNSLAEHQDQLSPTDVHDHPDVDCSKRTVERTMRHFHEQGVFAARDEQGRRVVYAGWDEEPHHVTAAGEVTLPPMSGEAGTGHEDCDRSHTITYVPLVGVPAPDPDLRPVDTPPSAETPDPGGVDQPVDGPPPG